MEVPSTRIVWAKFVHWILISYQKHSNKLNFWTNVLYRGILKKVKRWVLSRCSSETPFLNISNLITKIFCIFQDLYVKLLCNLSFAVETKGVKILLISLSLNDFNLRWLRSQFSFLCGKPTLHFSTGWTLFQRLEIPA